MTSILYFLIDMMPLDLDGQSSILDMMPLDLYIPYLDGDEQSLTGRPAILNSGVATFRNSANPGMRVVPA